MKPFAPDVPASRIVLLMTGIFFLIGGFLLVNRPDTVPVEERIWQSLQDAENGAQARSAGRILSVISDDFQAGMWNKKRLYVQVVRSLRDGRGTNFEARVARPRILPSPLGRTDERLVYSRLSVFYSDTGENIWGSGPLALVMRKESRRKWLFFQEPYWRIVSIANLPPLGFEP